MSLKCTIVGSIPTWNIKFMNLRHIGEDFSSTIKLHLLPGIDIPRGILTVDIQHTSVIGHTDTFNHGTYMTDHRDLEVYVGRDVRDISVTIYRHNSYPANPPIYFRYSMRLDKLILLNLACKLIKKP